MEILTDSLTGFSACFLREVFGKASGIPEAFPNTSPILPEENMTATTANRIRKAKRLSGQKKGLRSENKIPVYGTEL